MNKEDKKNEKIKELRTKEDMVNRIVDKTVEIAKMKEAMKEKKKSLETLVSSYRDTLLDEKQEKIVEEE